MKPKEWIFKNYPEQKEKWGETNHDDEFMCRMMGEYTNNIIELAFKQEYPETTNFINGKAKSVTRITESKIIKRVKNITECSNETN